MSSSSSSSICMETCQMWQNVVTSDEKNLMYFDLPSTGFSSGHGSLQRRSRGCHRHLAARRISTFFLVKQYDQIGSFGALRTSRNGTMVPCAAMRFALAHPRRFEDQPEPPALCFLGISTRGSAFNREVAAKSLCKCAVRGRLPCYVGNNLASGYCERVNSCAKLIMPHGRTLLDDEELEIVCFLCMNLTFIYYMKHQYPDVYFKYDSYNAHSLVLSSMLPLYPR